MKNHRCLSLRFEAIRLTDNSHLIPNDQTTPSKGGHQARLLEKLCCLTLNGGAAEVGLELLHVLTRNVRVLQVQLPYRFPLRSQEGASQQAVQQEVDGLDGIEVRQMPACVRKRGGERRCGPDRNVPNTVLSARMAYGADVQGRNDHRTLLLDIMDEPFSGERRARHPENLNVSEPTSTR